MTFLSWPAIWIAAGLTLPPLIALYFLKLKRSVRLVPSTLLWKRAVEDLQVNAPFQRLRRSLLLLLQVLVLIAAALALGKPMFETAEVTDGAVLLLIDQSASMSVREKDGRTRLEHAKEQAKKTIDSLSDDARAMVIAFCDRGNVVSSFDTDKSALKRKIDSIEQTDSSSTLSEAISLSEAHTQDLMIGGEQPGSDVAPEPAAPPATAFLFTDGRIEDAGQVALERFDAGKMRVINVGERGDNIGIIAMDASRNYERPEYLEVTAAIENFATQPATLDAVLYIDGRNVDVQTVQVGPAPDPEKTTAAADADREFGNVTVAAFDRITFEGGGLVEVVLQVDDALAADDRGWTVIDPPRRSRVLLVTPGNYFLEGVLRTLAVESRVMSPAEYESAPEKGLVAENRSAFDVVILDRHSTDRLWQGNYLFWGSAPKLEGISTGRAIDDEIIFDWDETHPILRHVAVQTMDPLTWVELNLPPEAVQIVEGERTPVMAYLTRDASQYLISAFSVVGEDEEGNLYRNGNWVATLDFVVLVQNMVQFLAADISVKGERGVLPGEPVMAPIPDKVETVRIHRPDGVIDSISTGSYQSIHYASTRNVGVYRIDPALPRYEVFAVNLFNRNESNVAPVPSVTLGAGKVTARAATIEVSKPAWAYFLLAVLALLLLEWLIYNRRVLV